MTPMKYVMSTDCEFIGGPVDGLKMRIDRTKGMCAFMEHASQVVTLKSCGVPVTRVPFYNRINDRQFQFVGYR